MAVVIHDGGSDDEIKVMTTLMGIDDNIMKSVIVVIHRHCLPVGNE